MAVLRAEERACYDGKPVYDLLVDATSDLAAGQDGLTAFGTHRLNLQTPGCMAYCLADGKVYARTKTQWEAAE